MPLGDVVSKGRRRAVPFSQLRVKQMQSASAWKVLAVVESAAPDLAIDDAHLLFAALAVLASIRQPGVLFAADAAPVEVEK